MRIHRLKAFSAALLAALVFSACGGDEADTPAGGSGDDPKAVEAVVRKSIERENAKDPKAFAGLWTDKGLEEYDVGTREELESGQSESFGEESLTIVQFAEIEAEDGKGSATVDVTSGEHKVAIPIFRARLDLIESDGEWLLDGFEFLGSPPPAEGTPIVNIDAKEYAFNLDKTETPGNFAFKFANNGKEPHEIAFFKAPAGTDIATAKAALENVDGGELDNLPAGYEVDHISFAESGSSVDLTFAEPVAAGEYFLVCYLPEGGFTDEGEPVTPDAAPHVKLGMINKLTIK